MSEMVERVAAALQKECLDTNKPTICWEDMARAAITAMRKPMAPMSKCFYDIPPYERMDDAELVWQAMIDAALR